MVDDSPSRAVPLRERSATRTRAGQGSASGRSNRRITRPALLPVQRSVAVDGHRIVEHWGKRPRRTGLIRTAEARTQPAAACPLDQPAQAVDDAVDGQRGTGAWARTEWLCRGDRSGWLPTAMPCAAIPNRRTLLRATPDVARAKMWHSNLTDCPNSGHAPYGSLRWATNTVGDRTDAHDGRPGDAAKAGARPDGRRRAPPRKLRGMWSTHPRFSPGQGDPSGRVSGKPGQAPHRPGPW
jgi:hypothetical protein